MNHKKSILAIHIDDDFLNIVYLEQSAGALYICSQTSEALDEGIIKDGLIADEYEIAKKIRNFIKTNHIKINKAVMALPCSSVRLKPSEFPIQTEKELRKQVAEQIAKYGLFGTESIVFDYCAFESAQQTGNKQTVLQAVTTRQISDACLSAAQKAGLELLRAEPAVLPVIKFMFSKQSVEPDTVSLLLAADSKSASLCVFKGELPQLCQNLNTGVKDLLSGDNDFSGLAEQMEPVLQFAYSLAGSEQLTLHIAGACTDRELDIIAERTGKVLSNLQISKINLSGAAEAVKFESVNSEPAPALALFCALTVFGANLFGGQLNLISPESAAIRKTQKELTLTAKLIIAIVLLSTAMLMPLELKIKNVKAASSEIKTKMIKTVPTGKKTAALKKQIGQIKAKLSVCDAADAKLSGVDWVKVLRTISESVPNQIRMVDISTSDAGEFIITGESYAERYIYKFEKKLRSSGLFGKVKVEEIGYDDQSNSDIITYKIICIASLEK